MQGKKEHQPQLFAYVDVEKLIPAEHLLRRIDKVLDLSFIRAETKSLYCADNGRPSIDPEVFFRSQLLSYIYDLGGDRQLCEEVRVNIAYRWFVGLALEDEVFDHSSMTRIRDRLGEEVFKKLFERMIDQCKEAGLVTARRLLHDACSLTLVFPQKCRPFSR
ncbi:MAG: transposase [Deltaproteobacteria bacterium]|jgi:transposase